MSVPYLIERQKMAPATTIARTSAVPNELRDALARVIAPERVLARPIDRLAFAADASFYRLIPQAVVLAKGTEEIQALFRLSHERRTPVTFRAAGTSLSGQAITDGILVEVARHWRGAWVEDGGKKVRVQPGIIGGHVNQLLRPYGVKIGPDPASSRTTPAACAAELLRMRTTRFIPSSSSCPPGPW
jgi:D-lactate dehydrogenase